MILVVWASRLGLSKPRSVTQTSCVPHEPSQGPHFLHGHITSGACYVRGRLIRLDFLAARLRYGAEQTHDESGLNVSSELSAPQNFLLAYS